MLQNNNFCSNCVSSSSAQGDRIGDTPQGRPPASACRWGSPRPLSCPSRKSRSPAVQGPLPYHKCRRRMHHHTVQANQQCSHTIWGVNKVIHKHRWERHTDVRWRLPSTKAKSATHVAQHLGGSSYFTGKDQQCSCSIRKTKCAARCSHQRHMVYQTSRQRQAANALSQQAW